MDKEKRDALLSGIEASEEETAVLAIACEILERYEKAFKELAK